MTTPLVQTRAIARTCLPAPATVRIKNLHTTIQGPHDAWGRPDRPQPLTISATVSLHAPFGSSSATDKLSSDTVHYGLLSKAILAILAKTQATTLRSLLEALWTNLIGVDTRGRPQPMPQGTAPFLNAAAIRMLEVTVHLPKASLVGGGVSLTATGRFAAEGGEATGAIMAESGLALTIHDLRVPTLIGVNSNERMAKQVVVANVEVDRVEDDVDSYSDLEQVIVKVRKCRTNNRCLMLFILSKKPWV